MNRPYKYTIICNKTKGITETNICPLIHHLQTWESTNDPNVKELKQTKTVYVDTRYTAKLRLYNYINFIKKGLEIPRYKPFEGRALGLIPRH